MRNGRREKRKECWLKLVRIEKLERNIDEVLFVMDQALALLTWEKDFFEDFNFQLTVRWR